MARTWGAFGKGALKPRAGPLMLALPNTAPKGHRDENFPVASRLIDARHRGTILAFYDFVPRAVTISRTIQRLGGGKSWRFRRLERVSAARARRTRSREFAIGAPRAGLSSSDARDLRSRFGAT